VHSGANIYEAAIGDYDSDGYGEVAISINTTVANGGNLLIYKNNQNNTFTNQYSISVVGDNWRGLEFGDINNDNKTDVVVLYRSTKTYQFTVGVFYGNGSGGYSNKIDYWVPTNYSSITGLTVVDLDGNNLPEVIYNGSSVPYIISNGVVSAAGYTPYYKSQGAYYDLNNDGTLEMLGVGANYGSLWYGYYSDVSEQSTSTDLDNNSLHVGGQALFRNSTNSTNALQVLNASGQTAINVDTVNNEISFGSSSNGMDVSIFGSLKFDYNTSYYEVQKVLNIQNQSKESVLAVNNGQSGTVYVNTEYGQVFVKQQISISNTDSINSIYSAVQSDYIDTDAYLDIVSVNSLSDEVDIFINDTYNDYAAKVSYAVGDNPTSVALADVNNDGRADIVTANSNSDNVSILINSGTGTFGTATNYAVGDNPTSVALADVNNDGRADIVTANSNSDNVSILINSGTGTFGAATNYTVGDNPTSVKVVDINHDSAKDIIITYDGFYDIMMGAISGLGTVLGTFDYTNSYSTGGNMQLILTDVDNDGQEDVVTYNNDYIYVDVIRRAIEGGLTVSSASNKVAQVIRVSDSSQVALDFQSSNGSKLAQINGTGSLILSNKDYTNSSYFSENATSFTMSPALAIKGSVTLDYNNDGIKDFALLDTTTNKVVIYTGQRQGANYYPSGLKIELTAGAGVNAIDAKDVNNDNYTDIVTVNSTDNTVSVFINNQSNNFVSAVTYPAGANPKSIAFGDINKDGWLDYVVSSYNTHEILVYGNDKDGTFTLQNTINTMTVSDNPISVILVDHDKDGDLDIISASGTSSQISIHNNTSAYSYFTFDGIVSSNSNIKIISRDFNNDGYMDIASISAGASNQLSIFINNKVGGFNSAVPYSLSGTVRDIVASDLSRDGFIDLAISTSIAYLYPLTNNKDGTFTINTGLYAVNSSTTLLIDDFNSDGNPDIFYPSTSSSTNHYIRYGLSSGTIRTTNLANNSLVVGGQALFQNASNSTSALAVQNVAGTSLLNVNTSAGTVSVSGATSGANTALTVTNSTSTGAIAIFSDDTTAVLTIANEGSIVARNKTNSTTAFLIQDSAGTTNLFTADTTNNKIIVTNLDVTGTLTVNGHIVTTGGTAPTANTTGAVCTGSSVSITGSDTAGLVTITTGTGCTAGTLATVVFGSAYGVGPNIILTPANSNAAAVKYYSENVSTTAFEVTSSSLPADSTQYKFYYRSFE
jgi:hypothetical protein